MKQISMIVKVLTVVMAHVLMILHHTSAIVMVPGLKEKNVQKTSMNVELITPVSTGHAAIMLVVTCAVALKISKGKTVRIRQMIAYQPLVKMV